MLTERHEVRCGAPQKGLKAPSMLRRQPKACGPLLLEAQNVENCIEGYVYLLHCLVYWFLHAFCRKLSPCSSIFIAP